MTDGRLALRASHRDPVRPSDPCKLLLEVKLFDLHFSPTAQASLRYHVPNFFGGLRLEASFRCDLHVLIPAFLPDLVLEYGCGDWPKVPYKSILNGMDQSNRENQESLVDGRDRPLSRVDFETLKK